MHHTLWTNVTIAPAEQVAYALFRVGRGDTAEFHVHPCPADEKYGQADQANCEPHWVDLKADEQVPVGTCWTTREQA